MMARCNLVVCTVLAVLSFGSAAADPVKTVRESARQIPLAWEVDVVVVGGSTGAVAAAVEAAQSGAKVFLAAPYPYLGEDMTATLRLWLEPGEMPASSLARAIFSDQAPPGLDPNRLPFRYEADLPSAGVHKDTDPPRRLTDGRWSSAAKDSVQYDGHAAITADLGKPREIREVRLMAYRRAGPGGFDVERIALFASDDKQTWKRLAVLEQPRQEGELIVFAAPVQTKARYLKLAASKPAESSRMLLGEIELIGTAGAAPARPLAVPPPRPMHVKKVLDEALLGAKVPFLYSCYATDLLRDAEGHPCGIVMANRAGRQAVVAKVVLDATERAWVARLAGARFRPYPAGTHTFHRVVIGGEPRSGPNLKAHLIDPPFRVPFADAQSTGQFKIIDYALDLSIADDSYAAWAAAEQQARTLTYHPEQQFTSDRLFQVPPDPMFGRQSASGPWQGVEGVPLGACQPAELPRVYVLGGCIDVPRSWAEEILRPLALIDLGTRVGRAAAQQARSLPAPKGVKLPGNPAEGAAEPGEVRESLQGVRPTQKPPTIPQEARDLPILGQYDVVVVGGGTAGAPAGIAAARHGARTLVVEYLHGLGGVGTLGAITSYYWGNRVGFSATVGGGNSWLIEQKAEWWRSELLKAGAEIWFGTIGCGALVQNDRVVGVVVATPHGRGVVLAKVVIDATGNADVAAPAGAKTIYTDQSEFGMQGTGLPGLRLGDKYNNTDFAITDETDMIDIWQLLVYAKNKYPQAFDQGRLIDTRERRRIVGDFTLRLIDAVNGRTYPDSVVQAHSDFDTHGYTVDPYTLAEHPQRKGFYVYIPYRAMLPAGLEGILVAGLAISAHRDAVPLIRMQADIQNGGYAAGVAAATAARRNVPLRNVYLREIQGHLVEIGNLPPSVLTDGDSYPLPDEQIAQAVKDLPTGKGASVVFAEPARAVPLLKVAYAAAEPKDKLAYARVLALLGDASGVETLMEEVKRASGWDPGWNYRAMGQYGSAFSPLDISIVALGYARDRHAVPVILEKLALLDARSDFSHHRAVGLALERIGDPAAARPLAELLARPGMSGHAQTSIAVAIQRETPGGTNAVQTRRESLRELLLARALYRCGDHQGVGRRILEAYCQDLRGHLARHAQAVLQSGPAEWGPSQLKPPAPPPP
ncbi:MAG: FAD-dependent oxidoreductase [Thermoguttaceae bacterium]